jgi:electron transfer flavoprotein alpha subunit
MIKNIAVFVECKDNTLRKASLELLSKAHELSSSVIAFLPGHEIKSLTEELSFYADMVIAVDNPALRDYRWDTYTDALAQLIKKYTPSMVFGPSTITGKDLFPRLSARLNTPLIADAVGIDTEGDEVKIKKPLFGGRIISWTGYTGTPLITFRPNSFAVEKRSTSGRITEENLTLTPDTRFTILAAHKEASTKVDLQEADFIICGGRGMKGPEHFSLLEEIATLMKGRVGASRAVVDNKWREYDDQIGKSGKTVSPKVYIGCGVSGALHHTMGMDTSKTIIAINKDPTAPIFEAADYGIVDDVFTVLPLLKEELIKAKGEQS